MSLAKNFPDYDPATLPAIPAHWADRSWRNDQCPSWACGHMNIWIDWASPSERTEPTQPRYCVEYGDRCELVTDDWQAVLELVARLS